MLHLVHIHKQYLCVSHKPFKLFSLPLNVLVKGFLAVLKYGSEESTVAEVITACVSVKI